MLLLLLLQFELVHQDPDGGADSAVSPDGGWIAFSSRRAGTLDLWLTNGRETRRLAPRGYEPRWSPDAKTIVFTSDRRGNQDLYLVDVATGAETELTRTAVNEDYPSFSFDAKKIVHTGGPWTAREVHILDIESRKITQITRGHKLVGAAAFSPDDATLVYHVYHESYESGESDLFVIPSAGGEARKLTDDRIWDYKPTWSPDGAWIAFSSKRDTACFNVWVVRPDGKDLHRVTAFEGTDVRWPNWTRDGRLAFHRITPHKGLLRRATLAGGVTDLATFGGRVAALAPSPDRSRLVYELNNALYVVEGDKVRELAKGMSPQWSPDGKRIAYLVNRRAGLRVIDVDGGKPVRLEGARPQWETGASAWSPDGAWLATVVDGQITVIKTKDGTSRKLTEGEGVREFPAWSADGALITFAEYHPQLVQYYLSKEPIR